MHLLPADTRSLDAAEAAVDLGQSPGAVVFASFTDSDLSLAAMAGFEELRLAPLARLRHPMSVDLYLDSVCRHARAILVRLLGGLDYWRYGAEELAALARAQGIALAFIPGDGRSDERLAGLSTVPAEAVERLAHYWSEGGPGNAKAGLQYLAELGGMDFGKAAEPVLVPRHGMYAGWREAGWAGENPSDNTPLLKSAVPRAERAAAPNLDEARPYGASPLHEVGRVAFRRNDGWGAASRCNLTDFTKDSTNTGASFCTDAAAGHTPPHLLSQMLDDPTSSGHPRICEQMLAHFVEKAASPAGLAAIGVAPPSEVRPAGRASLVFYRSVLLSGDLAPIDALALALEARGLDVEALFVGSLKDPETGAFIRARLDTSKPDVILNATAFSAQGEDGTSPLDTADCPVLQVITAASSEEAWQGSSRGLSASDLAMHVALPELDGRLSGGVISFKAEATAGGFSRTVHRPQEGRIAAVADKALAWVRLARTPRPERRVGLVLSNYPGAEGRLAHAVGLDAPASTLAILDRLAAEGYAIADRPADAETLLAGLEAPDLTLPLETYRCWLAEQSPAAASAITARWGEPSSDPACRGGAFRFAGLVCGALAIAVQPDRGSALDAKADHHSPDLPPRHAYLAFYLWLRQAFGAHAMIHLGTHGTLEWLPGKAVALSESCFPDIALADLPVLYPFIVNNPGEAAQAKRRLGAVTLGHMTPPLRAAGLSGAAVEVERLIDEYASADGLDMRRMGYLRREIVEQAEMSGLTAECGIAPGLGEEETLARLDAFLCDVKDLQIRDGLHVFGTPPRQTALLLDALIASAGEGARPALAEALAACGPAEMAALLAGLDGRFVRPGPAGAPTRGRADVLPTGRNLTTLDPRSVPTRAAAAIGARAAKAVVERYMQDHGDHPRRIVLDLWGSATMRTGGDDLAQALALMGVRPSWDNASNRVSGFEILPVAKLAFPRVDVTLRISGLFRDVFAAQITLFDEAVRAVAALEEDEAWNPLAAAIRQGGAPLRIFGAAPAAYGAGITDRIARGAWETRAELGRDYLAASGHAYGAGAEGRPAPEAFAERVAGADAHVHGQDHHEIDLLDDMTFAAHQGGFAAALEALGAKAALYHADLTDPQAPKLRSLAEEVARVVRGRAASRRWIEGMMAHGYAGAAEMANAMDSLFAFAATADVVTNAAFDRMHEAYVEDVEVAAFLHRANPAAGRAIRLRLAEAIRRGLWQPRRNSAAMLLDEPAPTRAAGGRP